MPTPAAIHAILRRLSRWVPLAVATTASVAVVLTAAGRAQAHAGSPIALPAEDLSALQVTTTFAPYGAKHILLGYDHLLFLAGLTLLSAALRDFAAVIALFFVSYSSALIGGTLAGVAVPGELVDAIIALSVVFVGLQIAIGREGGFPNRDPRLPALVFGLAHGLGLSTLLQALRLPGDDLLPSVIGFNAGVEIGQVVAMAALVGILAAAKSFPLPPEQRLPAGSAFVSVGAALALFLVIGVEL